MRIAIIGLGDIARKAYLPVIGVRSGIEPVLCSRNASVLRELAARYRVRDALCDVDALLKLPQAIDAAFIHTSTESHADLATVLLEAGIPVYVDKPLSYHYAEAERLTELAARKRTMLMTGFNRRFAPMVANLRTEEAPQLVMLQKNRTHLPDQARRFVFDDFIHVIDTLRFLSVDDADEMRITTRQEQGRLHQLVLQLESRRCTAIGVMNRDSGITEEKLELSRPGSKWVVDALNATTHFQHGEERRTGFGDWVSVLHRRGFEQIVDHFLECVATGKPPAISADDALKTHAVCERIVTQIEGADC